MTWKTVADVAFAEGRRLANDPNIIAVGHGAKLRCGQPVDGESVVFYVKEKLTSAEAISDRRSVAVPSTIDGFPTDVVEVGHLAAASADRAPPAGNRGTRIDDPLVGGVATMALGSAAPAGPGSYGTLGGQCFDSVSRTPLVLSNAHVWGTAQNTEIVQPIMASAVLGAGVTTAVTGTPAVVVQTRIPTGVVAPVAFANSIAQTYLITGSSTDPLPPAQGATSVPATTRTDSEQVTVTAPAAGLPPAGVRLSPTVAWDYQRVATGAVLQNSTSAARAATKMLTARRVFTNAASYTGSQPINLYGEVIPAPGGVGATAANHFVLALLYPVATGDKFIPRVLRPTARQTVTTVTTSFSGFPNPARAGVAVLPAVAGGFAVDSAVNGTFVTPPVGSGLPANTFVLTLPTGSVRLFVPIGTQVILDINLTGSPGIAAQAINSARDAIATTVTQAQGTGGRTLVTISASEIVEVVLTGVANAQLFGVTSKRSSPETTAPLAYAGTLSAADLNPKGKWGVSLFVQELDTGTPESANVAETTIGGASLITDCTFDVA
ncbi:MAG TPA: hypothetical protein VIF57_28000 [Polyangia bacterium]